MLACPKVSFWFCPSQICFNHNLPHFRKWQLQFSGCSVGNFLSHCWLSYNLHSIYEQIPVAPSSKYIQSLSTSDYLHSHPSGSSHQLHLLKFTIFLPSVSLLLPLLAFNLSLTTAAKMMLKCKSDCIPFLPMASSTLFPAAHGLPDAPANPLFMNMLSIFLSYAFALAALSTWISLPPETHQAHYRISFRSRPQRCLPWIPYPKCSHPNHSILLPWFIFFFLII